MSGEPAVLRHGDRPRAGGRRPRRAAPEGWASRRHGWGSVDLAASAGRPSARSDPSAYLDHLNRVDLGAPGGLLEAPGFGAPDPDWT